MIRLVDSFLSYRFFTVNVDDQLSISVNAGVPKGFSLSPVLFIIYTNDIPADPKSSMSLFVDDTMFYPKTKTRTWLDVSYNAKLTSPLTGSTERS